MRVAAVIVAAGRGERFGESGKVMTPLAERPMLAWSLDVVQMVEAIRDVVIVAGAHTEGTVRDLVAQGLWTKVFMIVRGGETRPASVYAGLRVVPSDVDLVVIHDAARPLAAPALFDECIAMATEHGAAIAAVPVTDTLKRVGHDGMIVETVDRAPLYAAQTPQAFRRQRLLTAFERSSRQPDALVTDEAMLFERLGWPVHIVPGSRENLKVTLPEDLAVAEYLLREREGWS